MSQQDSFYIIVSEGADKWIRKDAGPITRWWKRPKVNNQVKRWVHEKINPMRWIGEGVSSEYSQQMDILREVHSQIEEWTKDLSNALDRAQDARKLGKPLDCIFWLSQINNRLKLVADEKSKLSELDQAFFDNYFEQRDERVLDDYFETGQHKIVEAGVFNDLGREITTWRFNRSHKKFLAEQNRALVAILNLANKVVSGTYASLDKMSKALGAGDISSYIELLEKVGQSQERFQTEFRSVYNTYFAKTVERIKEKQKQEQDRARKVKDDAEQRERFRLEQINTPTYEDKVDESLPSTDVVFSEIPKQQDVPNLPDLDVSSPNSSVLIDVSSPSSQDLPDSSGPVTEPDEYMRPTLRSVNSKFNQMIIKANHRRFYHELLKAANKNDPYLLAAMMLKYSEMIDEIDPQKSLELLSIAEGILNV